MSKIIYLFFDKSEWSLFSWVGPNASVDDEQFNDEKAFLIKQIEEL